MPEDFQTYEDMANEGARYCRELEGWLATFSSGKKKRPDNEIQSKTRRLVWASKIVDLCRRAAEKRRCEAA